MFWKVKNLNPAQGFEHVKGYAGLAAGKPRGCSEHVQTLTCTLKPLFALGFNWFRCFLFGKFADKRRGLSPIRHPSSVIRHPLRLFTISSSTRRTPSSWFPQVIQFSWTLCGRPGGVATSIGRIEKWMSLNDAQGLAMIKLNRNARNAF